MAKTPSGSGPMTPGRKRRAPTLDLKAEEIKRGEAAREPTAGDAAPGAGEGEKPEAPPAGPSAAAASQGESAQPTTPAKTGAASQSAGQDPALAQEPAAGPSEPAKQGAAWKSGPQAPSPAAAAAGAGGGGAGTARPRGERGDRSPPGGPPPGGGLRGLAMPAGPGPWLSRIGPLFLLAALAGAVLALIGLLLAERAGLVERASPGQVVALEEQVGDIYQELALVRQSVETTRDQVEARLADLDERLAALPAPEERPDEAALAELREQVAALDAAMEALREGMVDPDALAALDRVEDRLQDLERTLAEAPVAAPQVEARLAELAEAVEAMRRAPAPDIEAALDDVASRMDDIAARLDRLERAVPAEDELASLHEEMAGLAERLGDAADAEWVEALAAQIQALDERVARALHFAPMVAAEALMAALDAGRPFAEELQAIRALGVNEEALAPLEPYAAEGLPGRRALNREFDQLMPRLIEADRPPAEEPGPLGRILESARHIVDVRPAGPHEGGDAFAVASRIDAALERGDLAAALEEWQRLPPESRAVSDDWADRLRARVAGEALAERLRRAALADLARAG
jgi:hypothetical protein